MRQNISLLSSPLERYKNLSINAKILDPRCSMSRVHTVFTLIYVPKFREIIEATLADPLNQNTVQMECDYMYRQV